MNEQYGNTGYNRVGENPFDHRDDGAQGDRYNNYAVGTYDNRTLHSSLLLNPTYYLQPNAI
jgi:hypothetical protein